LPIRGAVYTLPVNYVQKFVIVEGSAPVIEKTSEVKKNIRSTSYKVSFVEFADTACYAGTGSRSNIVS